MEGDLIHLRRADARDIDYWLMVNPNAEEKGALVVFNPLNKKIKKKINVPLYYTGLDNIATVHHNDIQTQYLINRDYSIDLKVEVEAGKWTAYFFSEN